MTEHVRVKLNPGLPGKCEERKQNKMDM